MSLRCKQIKNHRNGEEKLTETEKKSKPVKNQSVFIIGGLVHLKLVADSMGGTPLKYTRVFVRKSV